MITAPESCYICGAHASVEETDRGNRFDIKCSADDCGHYEIAVAAVPRFLDRLKNEGEKGRVHERVHELNRVGDKLAIIGTLDGGIREEVEPLRDIDEIAIEVDGKKYTGQIKIEGVRKRRFTVYWDGRKKTDAKDYPPEQEGYMMAMAKHVLWEMVKRPL